VVIRNATTTLQFIINRLISDINVSQGNVATYAGSGGIFDNHFAANLLQNLPVKELKKSVNLTELWPGMPRPDDTVQQLSRAAGSDKHSLPQGFRGKQLANYQHYTDPTNTTAQSPL